MEHWQTNLIAYCERYNIPLFYLAEIIDDPKVIPMIRGKAFEFTVAEKLQGMLEPSVWSITKPQINAQTGLHDIDVQVTHLPTNKTIRLECKLAKKGSCHVDGNYTTILVKCMRSRTLGEEMIERLSPKIGIAKDVLRVHNDQYLQRDFDFVITSLGNAFFQTDSEGKFVFSPNQSQLPFLKNFPGNNLQHETFHCLYIASSSDIAITPQNDVVCTRRKCQNKNNCQFIPNYPIMTFPTNSLTPVKQWHKLDDIELAAFFMRYLHLLNKPSRSHKRKTQ